MSEFIKKHVNLEVAVKTSGKMEGFESRMARIGSPLERQFEPRRLHIAVAEPCHPYVVERLLRARADVHAEDDRRRTAVQRALECLESSHHSDDCSATAVSGNCPFYF